MFETKLREARKGKLTRDVLVEIVGAVIGGVILAAILAAGGVAVSFIKGLTDWYSGIILGFSVASFCFAVAVAALFLRWREMLARGVEADGEGEQKVVEIGHLQEQLTVSRELIRELKEGHGRLSESLEHVYADSRVVEEKRGAEALNLDERITVLEKTVDPSGVHQINLVFRHVNALRYTRDFLQEISSRIPAESAHMADLVKREVIRPLSEQLDRWEGAMNVVQLKPRLTAVEAESVITAADSAFRACAVALESVVKVGQVVFDSMDLSSSSREYVGLRHVIGSLCEELERASRHPEVRAVAARRGNLRFLEDYENLLVVQHLKPPSPPSPDPPRSTASEQSPPPSPESS